MKLVSTSGTIAVAALAVAVACGGSKSSTKDDIASTNHHTNGNTTGDGTTDAVAIDAGADDMVEPTPDAGPPPPSYPVTIEIVNTDEQELTFSLNKGWQSNVNAIGADKKSFFLMFPKHCTTSCEAPEEERCPVCEEHETSKDEREGQQRQVVAPGETFELGWNGMAYEYKEKTRGMRDGKKTKKCKCYREVEAPAGEYNITVCGKRETTEVGVRSKLQCVEVPITLPVGDAPVRLRAEFPTPTAPKKSKKRHR